jgi:3-hydroxyisobutyrate dehydrogenase-like beta-hydroxyacid dehydrogenase
MRAKAGAERTEVDMSHVAFLGTGLLGAGMVERMLGAGTAVTVWNRTLSKARALEAFGATVAESPEDAAAGADRLHMIVTDDAVVDSLLERIGGRVRKGAIVIDHSTTSPAGAAARAARCAERGIRFVHAPVFMSPQMCRDGGGIMLASARQADFDEARDALAKMTGELWYLGERPDLAAAHKLFGNAMLFVVSGGLSDIFALAKGTGVELKDALAIFTKFNIANVITFRGDKMARADFSPSFELTMARKDVRLMMEAADGFPLLVLPKIAERMDRAIAAGRGQQDLAAVAAEVVDAGR